MNDKTPDDLEDEDAMRRTLQGAMEDEHPEESSERDPFATDALGHKPAEEEYGK